MGTTNEKTDERFNKKICFVNELKKIYIKNYILDIFFANTKKMCRRIKRIVNKKKNSNVQQDKDGHALLPPKREAD